MTARNGKPCPRCGGNEWYKGGDCAVCQRQRKRDNPGKNREYVRRWEAANPGKMSERASQWQKDNPERARERSRRYRDANTKKERERKQKWERANPDKLLAHWHRRRALKIGNGGSHTAAEWKAIKKSQGYTCLACGLKEPEIKLTVDHVIPLDKGGSNDASNIQGLCKSCNSKKHTRVIDYRAESGVLRWVQKKLFG